MERTHEQPATAANGLLKELHQRKVLRVAGLYLLFAVPILEVSDIVVSRFGLPDWTMSFVLGGLAIGFPVAVALAWYYDITREGVKSAAEVANQDPASRPRRRTDVAIFGALILALGYLGGDKILRTTADVAPTLSGMPSIAVLPFENMSADADNEYFSDGISEELLNALAKIPQLRVAGRTSSFYFKGKPDDLRKIGRSLNVENVLEGSVRKDGDTVRVTAQLVKVEDGFHLWSETYDYQLDDVFDVQDSIARSVVAALKIQLLGDQTDRLSPAPTSSTIAHTAYLRGRYELHRRTEESIVTSTERFRQAVEADPGYAAAWVGLAESYVLQYVNHKSMPRDVALAAADDALQRALKLDEHLAAAYAALGLLRMEQAATDAAEIAFKRALELDPDYAEAWHWYGLLEGRLNRLDSSFEKLGEAVRLDPLHRVARTNLGQSMLQQGDWDGARKFFIEWTQLEPDYATNYTVLAAIESRRPWSRPRQALEYVNQALQYDADDSKTLMMKTLLELELRDVQAATATVEKMAAARPGHPETIKGQLVLALYQDNNEAAFGLLDSAIARYGDQLGDQAILFAAIADLLRGDHETAVANWQKFAPDLFAAEPSLHKENLEFVPLAIYSLQHAGQQVSATLILDALGRKLDTEPRFGAMGSGLMRVKAAVLRGDTAAALDYLEAALGEGYRQRLVHGVWTLDKYPLFESLRNEPRFLVAATTLATYHEQTVKR